MLRSLIKLEMIGVGVGDSFLNSNILFLFFGAGVDHDGAFLSFADILCPCYFQAPWKE